MYAAHAEKKHKECSQLQLETSLGVLDKAVSDSDRFSAVLEITQHIRTNAFTNEDRQTVLQAMGFHFLSRLVETTSLPQGCPINLYKSVALSILSTLCVEPYVATHPEMKSFLLFINNIIKPQSSLNQGNDKQTKVRFDQMCLDSTEILGYIAQYETGQSYLVQCGTIELLPGFISSQQCHKKKKLLEGLSIIMKSRGDKMFVKVADKFHKMMSCAVDEMRKSNDLRTQMEFAKILTNLMSGISMLDVSPETEWTVKLITVIGSLIPLKLTPEDSQTLLYLVCGLVSMAGPAVLNPQLAGGARILKAVVARVSVEVYMLLDGISLHNASERYPKLDKVYKLLSDLIQFLAESGDTADSSAVISIYKKLLDISSTLIEFLGIVANLESDVPQNHNVVLITVRTLAAMLSEITEEPPQKLLELLPFFNLLCQKVEYSEDVRNEVKSLTQAAFENFKLMSMLSIQSIEEEAEEEGSATCELKNADSEPERPIENAEEPFDAQTAFSSDTSAGFIQTSKTPECNDSTFSKNTLTSQTSTEANKKDTVSKSEEGLVNCQNSPSRKSNLTGNSDGNYNAYLEEFGVFGRTSGVTASGDSVKETDFSKLNGEMHSEENGDSGTGVVLTEENLEDFADFQLFVKSLDSKPVPSYARNSPFLARENRRTDQESETTPDLDSSSYFQTHMSPDDILSYLLPSYAYLVEHQEALKVMVKCDSFQTIASFVEKSVTELLEGGCSTSLPESMTMNALGVIETVYSSAPSIAVGLLCVRDLIELLVLSVPNIVASPQSPPLVCLKMLTVSLCAQQVQRKGNRRESARSRLKHPQSRFFKAAVEYLHSFYGFHQMKRRSPSLRINPDFIEIWPLAEDLWCSCLSGLCSLVSTEEELRDALVKSAMLPEMLAYLNQTQGAADLSDCREEVRQLLESIFSLLEAAVVGGGALTDLILQNYGEAVARKFHLRRLGKHLQRLRQQ